MTDFAHWPFRERNGAGKEQSPPRTWDYFYLDAIDPEYRISIAYRHALALGTCSRGHTCMIVSTVHRIAPDGTLSPSYVCPVKGCDFHEFVRFVGWGSGRR